MEELTNRQARNLNALALKKKEISRLWGDKIEIMDTEDSMKHEKGILAMPLGGIKGKATAVSLRMIRQGKDANGKIYERDEGFINMPEDHRDVSQALKDAMKEQGMTPNGSSVAVVHDQEPVQVIGTKVPRKFTHKDMAEFLRK